ncbi:calcium-binding protein [Oleomonas cavernae]|uniref:Calcium-binding protein n=1 Tax=Oleomonas cavernae TaxID=2320859 RepID=A0A418WBI8_9PROT|nr:calcium-binding protein [Oleomonas cavernae]RJF87382.1 calcium-binding protein [Oleomonas cavernae]
MAVDVSYSLVQQGNTEFLSFGTSANADVVGYADGGFAVVADFPGTAESTLVTYSSLGNPSGQFFLDMLDPAVSRLGNGDVVMAAATTTDIQVLIGEANGGAIVTSGSISFSGGSATDVAGLKDGSNRYVVANQIEFGGSDRDIRVTIVDGISVVLSFQVDASTADDRAPSIAALNDGGFAVAWERHAGAETEVWYAVYEAGGAVRKAPTLLDTDGTINQHPSVTALASGGFVVAYEDNEFFGQPIGINHLQFSAAGDAVASYLGGSIFADSTDPSATTLSNGLLLTSFTAAGNIRASLFDPAAGNPFLTDLVDPFVIAGSGDAETQSAVSALNLARVVATYKLNDTFIAEAVFQLERTTSGDGDANVLAGDEAVDRMFGGGGNDTLDGGANNDRLDGQAGADTMTGGTGDDEYGVDDAGDVVVEVSGGGDDTVRSAIDYTLGANLERLILEGGALEGIGNSLANAITGNALANILNGGRGADTMSGGSGNDIYVVDNLGDQVVEGAGEGIDLVQSSATHTLSANVENLRLTGTASTTGTGNALDNGMTGNTAANRLFGLAGIDTIGGGAGNDTLEGGDDDDVLSGDAGDDTLLGQAGNDTLDGGTGNDSMRGGTGDDIYIVDSVGDTITEAGGGGFDTVRSTVSFTLGSGLDTLELVTSQAVDGTGNSLANTITGGAGANVLSGLGGADALIGNSGSDTLDGGTGADTMTGNAGNDTYVVDNAGDAVIEGASGGTDTTRAGISYTLTANVENLVQTGAGNIAGTGNSLANSLTGNSGANALNGADGKDTIDGRAGADTLTGGAGNDVFVFEAEQANGDTVIDFDGNGASAGDSLRFTGYGTAEDGALFIQLNATQWLIVSFGGGIQDTITFANAAAIHASDFVFV